MSGLLAELVQDYVKYSLSLVSGEVTPVMATTNSTTRVERLTSSLSFKASTYTRRPFMTGCIVHFSFRNHFHRLNRTAGLHIFSLSASGFNRHINLIEVSDRFSWTAVRICRPTVASHGPDMSDFNFFNVSGVSVQVLWWEFYKF
jgi:hypothetical protein